VKCPETKRKKFQKLLFVMLIINSLLTGNSFAIIELMTDEELNDVDGQVSEIRLLNHNQENDTVRLFLDIHSEVYGTIDSARVGYYYKSSSELRTTPGSIGLSGFEGFYHGVDNINNGANFQFMKVLSDFNTMAPQNGATLKPWGNGSFKEGNPQKTTTPNHNSFDWDIWADQLQIGESPDKPNYINGLIVRVEFDNNIKTNSHAKLKRLVIGTNDQQGNLYVNAQRLTTAISPMLLTGTTNRSAGVTDPYKNTPAPLLLQRDSMIQCFALAAHNVEDRDTGSFLTIDFTGDHLKVAVTLGYPENGNDFKFYKTDGKTGLEGIDVYDPGWAPYGHSGMAGSDPYNTLRQ